MKTTAPATDRWLTTLGYDNSAGVVHRSTLEVNEDHPYSREIRSMLNVDGDIQSSAVYEVDRVPAVCFIEPGVSRTLDAVFLDEVRRKIWNQNLVSIIVVIQDEQAVAYPVPRTLQPAPALHLASASASGPFSATDIASGDVHARLPNWFDRKKRVDRVLLDNLSEVVRLLTKFDLTTAQAQLLLGKCIFVSYLEDRGIIGQRYRERHSVGQLIELLTSKHASGLDRLFRRLKADFNGDLLDIEGGSNVDWRTLDADILDLLAQFLLQTRMRDGQKSLWRYDFKYIPVELISGIYESFLSDTQRREEGAVYTPRHLAALAVDEAFRGIDEPWNEVVLDGACGSGILLTSAYRRMLGAKQKSQKNALNYLHRKDILLAGIRGGDISPAACKVTAFSLYLVLLEDLTPTDIVALQDDQNVKLPPLIGKILSKEGTGDFFGSDNQVAKTGSATVVISNPPWFEPKDSEGKEKDELHAYEIWWNNQYHYKLPRRQIALAFARRATDALAPGGRLCLILPANILGAADTGPYLLSWFRELAPHRIFNLADMRRILFDGAVHPTAVISGIRRLPENIGKIPPQESFDYFVPKADVSLAFGRLTAHSFDRKKLLTYSACNDSEVLRTYFWGHELDESLIARLRLNGTFKDHSRGADARFVICKGFHKTDNKKAPQSAQPLRKYRFLKTAIGDSDFPKKSLFFTDEAFSAFPLEITTVADYGSKGGQAFDGVRVLFPDGTDSSTLEVRASYTDQPFCFTQSVAAIIDKGSNTKLMQFVAAYLRSKLARYLLFYTTFSLTMERPHIKVTEVENLPFALPEDQPEPVVAQNIIDRVVDLLKPYRKMHDMSLATDWPDAQEVIDGLIFDYFGLSMTERQVVNDTCEFFIPSMQPTNLAKLSRPLFKTPEVSDYDAYRKILKLELESWRDRLKGQGYFDVQSLIPTNKMIGTPAIVKIGIYAAPVDENRSEEAAIDIQHILDELRGLDSYPRVGDNILSVTSDFLIQHAGHYYLIKPMIKRLWMASAAAQDAYRIVETVRHLGHGG